MAREEHTVSQETFHLATASRGKGQGEMAVATATMAQDFSSEAASKVLARYSPTAVHRRRSIAEFVVAIAMAAACGLLFWGSSFATNMVHDQLSAQKISFPAAGSPALDAKTYPGLQKYGGQVVDNGPKAKAYANQYIGEHLQGVNGGKTYSQTSTDARAARAAADKAKAASDPTFTQLDAKATALEAQVQTLFRGETLRGLLLYAWGWWLVGRIAFWVAIAALVGAILLFGLAVFGVFQNRHERAVAS